MSQPPNNEHQDPAADPGFERLFSEYWESIYRVLFRLTGSHAEAEDLALETFWRFWQRPPADGRSIGGWLYRVATNLGYNALRAARRRQAYELETRHDDWLTQPLPDPAHAAEQASERRRVRAALSALPERQSRLLILRHSGLSYKEIAATLDIPVSSVGTLLVRAEKAFLRQFESEDDHASE